VGLLAHSVEDVAHLLAHLQGFDPNDPATAGLPWLDLLQDLEKGAHGLCIGTLALEDCGQISPGVERAYRETREACTALGAHLSVVGLPRSFDEYMQRAGDIMSAECYAELADLVDDDTAPIDNFIRGRVRRGRDVSARVYLELLDYRRLAQREWAEALAGTDALLVPTCPFPAIPITQVDENATPLSRLGRFVNLLDLCAIALPAGLENGLPVSVQIVAAKFHEPVALRVARALERATGWGSRHPVGV
jgi:aspartyl-tRNA(Asn)/glutamyl-tRNA(Gln) amidotransferase subunit A